MKYSLLLAALIACGEKDTTIDTGSLSEETSSEDTGTTDTEDTGSPDIQDTSDTQDTQDTGNTDTGDTQDTADTGTGDCSIDPATENDWTINLTGRAECGEPIYTTYCASCHGSNGEGGSGPQLNGKIANMNDIEMIAVIQFGKESMPNVGLMQQEVVDVIAWMKTVF